MSDRTERFSLDDLSTLADIPRRTVRYYIQQALVDRPEGTKRGAYYTRSHLEQLLSIKKWQRAGLSLERIRELLGGPEEAARALPTARPRQPGDVSVWSHILIHPGVELIIEPREAGLTPEQVRALAREAAFIVERLKQEGAI